MNTAEPVILAFDTGQKACDVALLKGANVIFHRREEMAKGQAERLLVLCSEIMSDAGMSSSDLAAVGVGTGPGNFTGLRIAISAARGLALGAGIPAVGVTAFEALRFGTQIPCTVSVDARRDDVYVQNFGVTGPEGAPRSVKRSELETLPGPVIGSGGIAPVYPLAVAIARITAERYLCAQKRPAPMYLKPADAAPAKEGAPTILT